MHDQGKSHYIPPSFNTFSSASTISQVEAPQENSFTPLLKYFFETKKESKKSNGITFINTSFLLFHYDLSANTFGFESEYSLDAGASKFTQVYDYFWFQNTLMVTSMVQGVTVVNISTCDFKLSTEEQRNAGEPIITTCADHAPTGVTKGFVSQIHGSTVWATVEYDTNTPLKVTVWNTHGTTVIPNWTTLNTMDGITQPEDDEHKWIRSV